MEQRSCKSESGQASRQGLRHGPKTTHDKQRSLGTASQPASGQDVELFDPNLVHQRVEFLCKFCHRTSFQCHRLCLSSSSRHAEHKGRCGGLRPGCTSTCHGLNTACCSNRCDIGNCWSKSSSHQASGLALQGALWGPLSSNSAVCCTAHVPKHVGECDAPFFQRGRRVPESHNAFSGPAAFPLVDAWAVGLPCMQKSSNEVHLQLWLLSPHSASVSGR
jgi:hypothetical protein